MVYLDIGDLSALTLLSKATLSDDVIRRVYNDLLSVDAKRMAENILLEKGKLSVLSDCDFSI